jgi:TRAP-type mannitol/chloroaromatic compound transport system permease large subunit
MIYAFVSAYFTKYTHLLRLFIKSNAYASPSPPLATTPDNYYNIPAIIPRKELRSMERSSEQKVLGVFSVLALIFGILGIIFGVLVIAFGGIAMGNAGSIVTHDPELGDRADEKLRLHDGELI